MVRGPGKNQSFSRRNSQVRNIALINYSLSCQPEAVQNKGRKYFLLGGKSNPSLQHTEDTCMIIIINLTTSICSLLKDEEH